MSKTEQTVCNQQKNSQDTTLLSPIPLWVPFYFQSNFRMKGKRTIVLSRKDNIFELEY